MSCLSNPVAINSPSQNSRQSGRIKGGGRFLDCRTFRIAKKFVEIFTEAEIDIEYIDLNHIFHVVRHNVAVSVYTKYLV